MELEYEGHYTRGIFVQTKGKETGAKKIIEFIIDNENLEKSFSYKDTLPDYVNYDLFD